MITSINWADEFDVEFGEIITKEDYQKYQFATQELKELLVSFYFGTNEGWDDDFDLLGFDYTPITDEEYKVLSKFGLPNGEGIMYRFYDKINDALDYYNYTQPSYCRKDYMEVEKYNLQDFKNAILFLKANNDWRTEI